MLALYHDAVEHVAVAALHNLRKLAWVHELVRQLLEDLQRTLRHVAVSCL